MDDVHDFKLESALQAVRAAVLDSKRFPYEETAQIFEETVARYYQNECVDRIMEHYVAGNLVALVELCCGSGKTKIIKMILDRMMVTGMCKLILLITHKTELENQFRAQYRRDLASPCRYNEPDGHSAIHTATAQELIYARAKNRSQFDLILQQYDGVVIDEAQHYPEGQRAWGAMVNEFIESGVRTLGLSATIDRHDKLPVFREKFDDDPPNGHMVYRYDIVKGVRDRFLCEVEGVVVSTHLTPRKAEWKGGNLELSFKKADRTQRNRVIRDTLVKIRGELGRVPQAVVFVSRVDEARQLSHLLNRCGELGASTYVDGSMTVKNREAIYRRFERGQINVIVNVQVTTEGVNLPSCDLVAMARPTRSRPLYFQMLGRGTRAPKGKEFLLVVDFVDNLEHRHTKDIVVMGNLIDRRAGIPAVSSIRQECKEVEVTGVSYEKLQLYGKHLPFAVAREWLRSQGLNPSMFPKKEWTKILKTKKIKKPKGLPSNPAKTYAGEGWIDWWDWFGRQPGDEVRYCKELTTADRQAPRRRKTNVTGKIRLGKSCMDIKHDFFHSDMFGNEAWTAEDRNGKPYECLDVDFQVYAYGESLGKHTLRIDHATHRASGQANVQTYLSCGNVMRQAPTRRGDWISIERTQDGTATLTLSHSPPDWPEAPNHSARDTKVRRRRSAARGASRPRTGRRAAAWRTRG